MNTSKSHPVENRILLGLPDQDRMRMLTGLEPVSLSLGTVTPLTTGGSLRTQGSVLTHPNSAEIPDSSSIKTIGLDYFERADSGASFAPGASVRLTEEVPRAGFLYVIDREKYSDERLGDPYLIFPTKRTNGGDNSVSPGRLVEIPSHDDQPPFSAGLGNTGLQKRKQPPKTEGVRSEPERRYLRLYIGSRRGPASPSSSLFLCWSPQCTRPASRAKSL